MRTRSIADRIESASSSSDDEVDLGTSIAASRQSSASIYSSYEELISAWSAHDLFRMFLEDDFDADKFFAGMHQQSMSRVLEKLNGALKAIDQCVYQSVSSHLEDLLRQSVQITGVARDAELLQSDCNLLKSTYASMYDSVMNPFEKIKTLVQNAEEAQDRAQLLRNIFRFVQLVNKAKQCLMESQELSRIASILSEISSIVMANELNSIDSLHDDYLWVQQKITVIRSQAEISLKAAMLQNNQVQIGSSLQISYNLSTLTNTVEAVINEFQADFLEGVSQLFDKAKLFSPQGSKAKESEGLQPANSVRTSVWQRLERVFDLLFDTVTCIHALHSVLNKKSDPVTRQTYAEIIGRDINLLVDVTFGYLDIVQKQLSELTDSSKTVSNMLSEEFPRLYDICESCWQRGLARLLPYEARLHIFRIIEAFQNRYLSERVAKVQDPITAMFANTSNLSANVPTTSDIATVMNYIVDTLASLEMRTDLQRLFLKGISGPLNLCVSKCEALIGNETSLSPLLWNNTVFDRFNAILCFIAYLDVNLGLLAQGTHHRYRMLSKDISEPLLRPIRQNVKNIGFQILDPVFLLTRNNLEISLEQESSIVSVVQSELDRNKTSLLRLSSKPGFLRFYILPFVQELETMVLYRYAAILSAGCVRKSTIQQTCGQLNAIEDLLKSYTDFPNPRKKNETVALGKPMITKISTFRNWIGVDEWRPPTESEIAALPKIVFVCCSIGMAQSLVPVCDLVCMTPAKLYQWMLSHSEHEAMKLCQDQVIANLVADDDLSRKILQFITELVDNAS